MLQWYRYSERLNFSVLFVIGTFWTHKLLCQPMDRVFSWDSLTDSNVISAVLSVRRPDISNVCCRCEIGFIISFILSLSLSSQQKYCTDMFVVLSKISLNYSLLIQIWKEIWERNINIDMPVCSSVKLYVSMKQL
jgi:hypothetical protein